MDGEMALYRECCLPKCKKNMVKKVTFLGFKGSDRPNRLPWIRPWTRVGDKPGYQSFSRNFYALFSIFKKMLCWSTFHVKPLNKLPITSI